jgi:hypothetical protein
MRHKSTCSLCGGPNDGVSSLCTRPMCLASHWESEARWYEREAEKYIENAADCRRKAAELVAEANAEHAV